MYTGDAECIAYEDTVDIPPNVGATLFAGTCPGNIHVRFFTLRKVKRARLHEEMDFEIEKLFLKYS